MRETLSQIWAWTKLSSLLVVVGVVVTLLLINLSARIEPGINLLVVKFDRPNAILALLTTAIGGVLVFHLSLAVYRAIRYLRSKPKPVQSGTSNAEVVGRPDAPKAAPEVPRGSPPAGG
jgi:hypothetical protein